MKKSDMTIVRDTREQLPLTFPEAKVKIATLSTGDYSLEHFEDKVTIERKSLPDLLGSLGNDRDRFMREIQRMQAFEYAGLVIEASMQVLYKGNWRSDIKPQSVVGSLQALSAKYGIHVFLADNHELAARTVEGLLFHFLRKQYELHERLRPLLNIT
ncbi:MAG: ERCC4 domain-containing protein [Candidatus Jettenia sp. CY-1]|nr:MAG: ERCC4 domain-containing protein [Candidatus Jettenia sp. CY-1]